MLGIKAVASYIPQETVDNFVQAEHFGEPESFVTKKIGAEIIPVKASDQETSDLCVLAVQALMERTPDFMSENLDVLVVVTQNGDGEGLPHTSAVVQDKLELPSRIAAFDVSLGCSGYVYGLHIIKGFMQAIGAKNGLLIIDAYSQLIETGADFVFSVAKYAYQVQRALRINAQGFTQMRYPEYASTRSQDLEDSYHDAGQFYWGRTAAFLSNLSALQARSVPYVMPPGRVQDIDTPEDWEHAELLFRVLNEHQ